MPKKKQKVYPKMKNGLKSEKTNEQQKLKSPKKNLGHSSKCFLQVAANPITTPDARPRNLVSSLRNCLVLALEVSNIKDGGKFPPNLRLNCGTVDVRISEDPISFCWYIRKLPNMMLI